jgi:transposase-like protein
MVQLAPIVSFKSLIEMLRVLPDDNACREYLEMKKWGGVPTCPHCGSKHSYTLKTKGVFKGMYKCVDCQQRYNVKDKTMFEGSHIGLHKWFMAIYVFSMHKKGISSHQLASDLGITQKSAWFMLHRIRLAFKSESLGAMDCNTVEVDATYIGGKTKNKHAWQRKEMSEKFGRGTGSKTAVLGILNRDGKVVTQIVESEAAKNVESVINDNVDSNAIVITDAHSGYKDLNDNFFHVVVNHQDGEYVKGIFHTNNIEGFWSQMKRGIYGIYHHVSVKHLGAYGSEFSYRYNVRKQTVNEKFNYSLMNSKRLMYKTLIAE